MALVDVKMSRLFSWDSFSIENESNLCMLAVLASLLQRLVARNERLLFSSGKSFSTENLCVFAALQVPEMGIEKFLERIFKYSRCSPSAFVVAYVYIDRLILNNPSFRITSLNIHRLVITSVMVATKFLDDLHCNNGYFAKVGGLTLEEMNILEVEFLFMLRFRLHVTVSVFESHCSHFEREVALGGGIQIERTLLCASRKEISKLWRQDIWKVVGQRLVMSSRCAGC
ncbi:hypothetical protein SUGI_0334080 [Cryptomeria japonica]|uniref:cyclin-U2-1 n=1 Tax=Cryptomeria japonica TaxID=3369 RepID=UPI002408A83A|nr:cyclin-U2-1 [Cryptomeria japonica]GLJ18725.1 hypothetical protein SUGI_0334080 [Cryptomeria japonica]